MVKSVLLQWLFASDYYRNDVNVVQTLFFFFVLSYIDKDSFVQSCGNFLTNTECEHEKIWHKPPNEPHHNEILQTFIIHLFCLTSKTCVRDCSCLFVCVHSVHDACATINCVMCVPHDEHWAHGMLRSNHILLAPMPLPQYKTISWKSYNSWQLRP